MLRKRSSACVQVQLSGTDVVTGIDSPDQYQTNAYFKVRLQELRSFATHTHFVFILRYLSAP